MHFFHGFALQDEARCFQNILDESDYAVSGFSYGAIKAFQHVLGTTGRVDRLQLLSPAFFQKQSMKFRRLQMMGYQKDHQLYIEKFTENCFLPYSTSEVSYGEHSAAELEELLNFEWSVEDLQTVIDRGVKIDVYLGGKDQISDVVSAYDFFKPFATVTLIKEANHFLQGA